MKQFLTEFWLFGIKQAYACIFGGILLFFMILSGLWYPEIPLHRYDFLFMVAVVTQILLVLCKLEQKKEIIVILLFHVLATCMELFKTSQEIGAWTYPEPYMIGIAGVPLFAGFMYSAVGSYIARSWKIESFHFTNYPKIWITLLLVLGIYINFFTQHYLYDIRYILFGLVLFFYRKTWLYFRISKKFRKMPLLIGLFLVAFFIWIAENIGTLTNIWRYPEQYETWELVSPEKILAWFLLMLLSFVLVSLVHKPKPYSDKFSSGL